MTPKETEQVKADAHKYRIKQAHQLIDEFNKRRAMEAVLSPPDEVQEIINRSLPTLFDAGKRGYRVVGRGAVDVDYTGDLYQSAPVRYLREIDYVPEYRAQIQQVIRSYNPDRQMVLRVQWIMPPGFPHPREDRVTSTFVIVDESEGFLPDNTTTV
jgi:hypothetical protein